MQKLFKDFLGGRRILGEINSSFFWRIVFFFFNPGEFEGDLSINQSIQDGKQRQDDVMSRDIVFH